MNVAALFVEVRGAYAGLENVDAWPLERDARKYRGPVPVVAHPPCARWCRLAGLVEARWGYKRGDDGGCFKAALKAVRKWGGGYSSTPAYSDAWAAFELRRPDRLGGWQRSACGGWVTHVEQGRYGHRAKKATWLYVFGAQELPPMRWGSSLDTKSKALVSWCGNHVKSGERRPRLRPAQASATPPAFREVLLRIARSCS